MPTLTRRTLHLILCLAALLPLARPAPAQVPVAPAQAPAAPPAHFEPATGTIVDARWKSGVPPRRHRRRQDRTAVRRLVRQLHHQPQLGPPLRLGQRRVRCPACPGGRRQTRRQTVAADERGRVRRGRQRRPHPDAGLVPDRANGLHRPGSAHPGPAQCLLAPDPARPQELVPARRPVCRTRSPIRRGRLSKRTSCWRGRTCWGGAGASAWSGTTSPGTRRQGRRRAR